VSGTKYHSLLKQDGTFAQRFVKEVSPVCVHKTFPLQESFSFLVEMDISVTLASLYSQGT
jgi:hypothetical protein